MTRVHAAAVKNISIAVADKGRLFIRISLQMERFLIKIKKVRLKSTDLLKKQGH